MKFKRIITILIIIFLVFSNYISFATDLGNTKNQNTNQIAQPEVFAESAILLDVDSNKILYEKNSQNKMYPASTTKLLTAILVVEKCPDLSQLVNISYYAVNSVPYTYSTANMQPGEQFSIKDLLYALLVESANDAAFSLAEYVANNGNTFLTDESQTTRLLFESSMASFSNMMNSKAKELGCQNTNFVNPNGIHNENHYSSAYDLMLIGKYAYSNSTIRSICKTVQYSLPRTNLYNEPRVFNTTNSLLRKDKSGFYAYANGLKTGFTDASQSCIIASANKGDRNLITVILHSEKTEDENASRESDCKRLFEYGFNYYTNSVLVNEEAIVKEINILNGTKETNRLNAICGKSLKTLIVSGEPIDVTPEITINKLLAPISKGEVIGTITYKINDETLSSDLLAEHDVYAKSYGYYILIVVSIFFVFLCISGFIVKRKKRRKEKQRNTKKIKKGNRKKVTLKIKSKKHK